MVPASALVRREIGSDAYRGTMTRETVADGIAREHIAGDAGVLLRIHNGRRTESGKDAYYIHI